MNLVIFLYWVGPVPYLELFWAGPVKINTLYIEVVSHLMHPQSILGPGETIIFVDVNIFSWSALLAYAFSIHS